MTVANSDNRFGVSDWIVDAEGIARGATHSTIAGANAVASSGDTIFIRPGTYTENFTAVSGVNYVGFNGNGFSSTQATINGKITLGSATDMTFKNLRITTNADYAIEDTGASSGSIRFLNCTIMVSSTGGVNLNNANRTLTFVDCQFDRSTNSLKIYNVTTCATLTFEYCVFSSASFIAVADTIAAGILGIRYCTFNRHAIALSGSATLNLFDSTINSSTDNLTGLDCSNTSGTCFIHGLSIRSGTAAGLNIGASSTVVATDLRVQTSNTNAVSGSGTFQCSGVECSGTGIAVSGSLTWSVGDLTLRNASGGGAWTLISTATASASATIEFTGLSTDFMYMIVMQNVAPATDGVSLNIRTSTNNGVSFDSGASDYAWQGVSAVGGILDATINSTGATFISIFGQDPARQLGNGANETLSGIVEVYNPSSTSYTQIYGRSAFVAEGSPNAGVNVSSGIRQSAADVDAIQFLMSSGNIATGTFKLYGLAAS